VLSVSFGVTGRVRKVGSLATKRRRRKILGGLGACPPPEHFETWMLGNAISSIFQEVFSPKMARKTSHGTVRI